MKRKSLFFRLLSSLSALFLFNTVYAGSPVWTFTPLTETTISVPSNGSETVQYVIKNQSKKTHILKMKAIAGIAQITTAGNCSSTFTLGYQESCTLTLEVNGSLLQGNIKGGPEVCESGDSLLCYQPSQANSLNITSISTETISLSSAPVSLTLTVSSPSQEFTITGQDHQNLLNSSQL